MKLSDPISKIPKVGPVYVNRLKKLGIETVSDLLKHYPFRYVDYSKITKIGHVKDGDQVTIKGRLNFIKNQYTRGGRQIQFGEAEDDSGKLKVIWFNQPFLIMTMKRKQIYAFSGEVGFFGNMLVIASPQYELFGEDLVHTGRVIPIYPETKGVGSKWIRGKIHFLLEQNPKPFDEYHSQKTLSEHNLIGFNNAINLIHFPATINDAFKAKKRISFDEMLFLHLRGLYRKKHWQENQTLYKLRIDPSQIDPFIKSFPFILTRSQNLAINDILSDMKKSTPMNRLLEGDVGSGKTVVAATACFASFLNGFQSVIMAPTQILATQHFETLKKLFEPYKIRVKLVTSSGEKGDLGSSDVYVGTHALIHRVIQSKNVSLVVIDEQHRFGVKQRNRLVKQVGSVSKSPHILTMTATPIPRTIALTLYADLSLSVLRELPKGRVPISTWIVPGIKRKKAYEWIKKEIISEKSQVFIVCPLIEESEVDSMSQIKAATAEFENIKKIFDGFRIGLLHGRLKAKEKEYVIDKFRSGKIDLLVTTPVVEVGVDIPGATIMIIEAAERFGLAQLHQLRGRIGRSSKKSYCMLFSNSKSDKVEKRLNALKRSLSGFELAELDLKLRGPGEIYGILQHGFDELKIASWNDESLIINTKELAEKIITHPSAHKKILTHIKTCISFLN